MYMVDFVKKLFKGAHVIAVIYLAINIALVTFIMAVFLGGTSVPPAALPFIGAAVYLCSAFIALSPVGESIMRLSEGCKTIKDAAVKDRLDGLFKEVYDKAKAHDPNLSDNINLYIKDDPDANAFALGLHTICVHKGMLDASDDEIKGVLGHELGHIAHRDTDLVMLVTVGNLLVTVLFIVLNVINGFFTGMGRMLPGSLGSAADLTGLLVSVVCGVFMWVWTKIGVLMIMASSRQEEYAADKFSAELGYADGLADFLRNYTADGAKGLFAALAKSHPNSSDRIAKIEEAVR